MSDDPTPPFTVVELEIANLAGKGYGHWRIAAELKRSPFGVRKTIQRMAAKLTEHEGVAPLTRIQLWGAHQIWLTQHRTSRDTAA
jgi:DNA-binding NarL/FixJ family response regulator